ncbi:Hypothetical predicted protein [Olea europaea subsp. europaea]|uniref:Uncharacterized protein n=1 Tax=Olea europaea subsp. europaea TaxID=158383 RepID=A0A8S0TDV9_OLEEU|nr:Hypothetical predicted protein [Olea europaea subsp. europaea]
MSRNYDNWERLVGAVLQREQDREVARADSRSTSFSSISISLDFDEHSLSLPREEQNVENGRRNSRLDSSDGSYVASSTTKGIAGCKVDLEGAQGYSEGSSSHFKCWSCRWRLAHLASYYLWSCAQSIYRWSFPN